MVSMNRKQVMILAAGVLIVLTLWLVGGSVSNFEFEPGRFFYGFGEEEAPLAEGIAGSSPAAAPDWVKVTMFIVVWILLPLSVLFLIFDPKSLKAFLARVGSVAFWIFVIYMLSRLASQMTAALNDAATDEAANLPAEDLSTLFPNSEAVVMPWWTQWVASFLILLLVVGVFFWIRKINQARKQMDSSLEDEIAVEAGQAAAALRQGGVLQEVILRCYQSMSEVLASKQRAPQDALTPREFERELQRAGVVDPHISKLSRLFERVRYGSYQAASEDEAEALSCLEGIEKRYRSHS